jgi:RNA polymerase sigma-70 factor (ECF subfamily)
MALHSGTIEACKKDDRIAIKRFYETCSGWMLGVARRYIYDRTEAMGVVNHSLLTALENLKTFDESRNEKIESWLKTILIRKLIDYQRKEKKYSETEETTVLEFSHGNTTNKALNELRQQDLMEMIRKLPDRSRTVFNLYAIEGYAHKEIGGMLKISDGTSKWFLSDARMKLRKMLNVLDEPRKAKKL